MECAFTEWLGLRAVDSRWMLFWDINWLADFPWDFIFRFTAGRNRCGVGKVQAVKRDNKIPKIG